MGLKLQLTITRCILREKLPVEAVETVAAITSNFLVADMTLARACEISHLGMVELPMLMWSRSQPPCDGNWSGLQLLHSDPRYFHRQYTQALIQSIRRGDLKLVQWLLSQFPEQPTEDVVEEIVENEQMEMIQLFEEKHVDEILDQAAKSGRWDLVHRLDERMSSHSQWRVSSNVITHEAVYQNKLEEVKWAIANDFWLGEIKLNRSPETEWPQRKEVLLYLLEREEITVRAVVRQAAEAGDIPFLGWFLVHNQPNFPSEAMFAAAGAGQLEVVKYLYEEYDDDPNVVLFREGEVILPRQVREDNFFRPSTTMDVAARNGHLDILQFLHEIEHHSAFTSHPGGYPTCTSAAMDAAAARGHLDVVKWLHIHRTEGCTTKAMDLAASRRYHVPSCLGSPSDTCCLDKVPSGFYADQLEVVRWLQANRSEGCSDIAMDGAASNGDFAMLKWLHFNTSATCTHKAMDGAAALGRLDIVQWLELNRTETVSPVALVSAAANGHLNVVKWLHKDEWSTSVVLDAATANGHLRVVQWLLSDQPKPI